VRPSVICSIVLHVALLGVAFRLPAATAAHSRDPITVEIETHPLTPPVPPAMAPEPPRPAPRPPEPPKIAMHTVTPRDRRTVEEPRPQTPEPPPSTQPQPSPSQPQPSTNEPPRKLDLTLHGLPPGTGGGTIAVPSEPGAPTGAIIGTPTPAKKGPWRPRGDAGDPILGKLKDKVDDEFPLTSLGKQGYVYDGSNFQAHITIDGSVSFDDKYVRDFKGLSGTFDVNDLIMKGKKEDPYRYQKQKFLAATAEKRALMAKRFRQEEARNSIAQLPSRLDAIWSHRRMPARERRKLIFELWKEAAPSEPDLAEVAAEARATIEAYVRRALPDGSEDAFTVEELADLNRGQHAPFAPYR
jgi:hypothetical protein